MGHGNKRHKLQNWEIPLVKAMLARNPCPKDQDILCYFTRPARTSNHARIAEIRTDAKHKNILACSDEMLEYFFAGWPHIDPETGLHLIEDELILKAREAMIAAVHIYNSAGLTFRAELFIVTTIIAWTYILHAWYKQNTIDHRYYKHVTGLKTIQKTSNGAVKYWDLQRCLDYSSCPLDAGVKNNLSFLLEIRHEIEHRSTSRIDSALSAKLQAACINFNEFIKTQFGDFLSLEDRLSIALQFSGFNTSQKDSLKKTASLPQHIETTIQNFQSSLSDEEYIDQQYAYRVALIQTAANRKSAADEVVEFVSPDSSDGRAISRIINKKVEKPKYLPSQVVKMMQQEGYPLFSMRKHTNLWKEKNARRSEAGYGAEILGKQWVWYENWLEVVREHCKKNKASYNSVVE